MNEQLTQAKKFFFEVGPCLKEGRPHEALAAMARAVELVQEMDFSKREQSEVSRLMEKVVHRINMDPYLRKLGVDALEYAPGREHVLYNLVQRLRKDLSLAEKRHVKRALEEEIARIGMLHEKGMEHLETGDMRRALSIFTKLARDYDCSAEMLVEIGKRLKDKGEHLGAVDFFERAVLKEPDNTENHTLAAYAFQRIRRMDKAEAYFLSSLEGCEDAAQNYQNLAKFYMDARMWDKAQEAIAKSLEASPHDPQALEMQKRIEAKVFVHDPADLREREFLMEGEEGRMTGNRIKRLLGRNSG